MKSTRTLITLAIAGLFAAGVAIAAEAKKEAAVESKQAACCAKAEAAGKKCDHECCVEAAKKGMNCEKCKGSGPIVKKDAPAKK